MNSKRTKIIVDIFMALFMGLSFLRWDDASFAFHAAVGSVCTLAFAAHVFLHRKWVKATTISCFKGSLSKKLLGKYVIDMLLLLTWGVSIVTGFLAVAPFFSETSGAFAWGRLHGITARIGLALVVIHVIQHIPQIKSYFRIKRIKKRAKNES